MVKAYPYGSLEKCERIDDYIQKIDEQLEHFNIDEAKELQTIIIGVYSSELSGIYVGIDRYGGDEGVRQNLIVLRGKLNNHKDNLRAGLFSGKATQNSAVYVNQSVNQEVSTTVSVSLESTISLINELPKAVLSDDDKDTLNGKLASISAEQQKERRWEKAKNTLKWIADKGIEVGIAALPYIVKMLEEAK